MRVGKHVLLAAPPATPAPTIHVPQTACLLLADVPCRYAGRFSRISRRQCNTALPGELFSIELSFLIFPLIASHGLKQWAILSNLPPSEGSRPGKWEVAVDCDLKSYVIENAMTLEVNSGYASSLMLKTSDFLNVLSFRINKYLLVPQSFSCSRDVQLIRFVVRVVVPKISVDSRLQWLKDVSVLERQRSLIATQKLNHNLLLKETQNWPSVSTFVNEINTLPLQSLDPLYQLCSIHEVCIDFARHFPISEMTSIMESVVSAGLQSQVTIPGHSIYLRGVQFRPESLVFGKN